MANDVRKWDTVKTDSKGKARMDDVAALQKLPGQA